MNPGWRPVRIGLASPEAIRQLARGNEITAESRPQLGRDHPTGGMYGSGNFGLRGALQCGCRNKRGLRKTTWSGQVVGGQMAVDAGRCLACGEHYFEGFRRRFGYIELVAPVLHPWFGAAVSQLLGVPPAEVHGAVYDTSRAGASELLRGLEALDLAVVAAEARAERGRTRDRRLQRRATLRAELAEGLTQSGQRPEWMVLRVLPVPPPLLRPLDEPGAPCDEALASAYGDVLERNDAVREATAPGLPRLLARDLEVRLQRAVDALLGGGRGPAAPKPRKRQTAPFDLTSRLTGKQGRIRRDLLGKRVDFSGRAVIAPGPELGVGQAGIPIRMALGLFAPMVVARLREELGQDAADAAFTARGGLTPVWPPSATTLAALQEVVRGRRVLLNRQPTLHRLNLQAFAVVLIEGAAIRVNPLVCPGFNADFDGDQMTVHLPIGAEAQREADTLMAAERQLRRPGDRSPTLVPTHEATLGLHLLTTAAPGRAGEGMVFASPEECRAAADRGVVHPGAQVQVRCAGRRHATTVGRALLWQTLEDAAPGAVSFEQLNTRQDQGTLSDLVSSVITESGPAASVAISEALLRCGLEHATDVAPSICMADFAPADWVAPARAALSELHSRAGQDAQAPTATLAARVWSRLAEVLPAEAPADPSTAEAPHAEGDGAGFWSAAAQWLEASALSTLADTEHNPLGGFLRSGARTKPQQVRQLLGPRGLFVASGRKGQPSHTWPAVLHSLGEGLTPHELMLSARGARRTQCLKPLHTGRTGALQRLLVYALRGVTVRERACSAASAAAAGRSSLIGCESPDGVCAACYGDDPATGAPVALGAPVGIIAAQSLCEPLTQATLDAFHSGGAQTDASQADPPLRRLERLLHARWDEDHPEPASPADLLARLKTAYVALGVWVHPDHHGVLARELWRPKSAEAAGEVSRPGVMGIKALSVARLTPLERAAVGDTRVNLEKAALAADPAPT